MTIFLKPKTLLSFCAPKPVNTVTLGQSTPTLSTGPVAEPEPIVAQTAEDAKQMLICRRFPSANEANTAIRTDVKRVTAIF
jgi:hypothetical protein